MKGIDLGKSLEILLIEDSISDIELIIDSFQKINSTFNINVLNDGANVIPYMNKVDTYFNSIRPNLIILDLSLPNINGFDILKELKSDLNFKSIPIIILSSSSFIIDIDLCYNLYANAYIVKPNNLYGFRNIVKQIEQFWFSTVELIYNELS
jgi:two-component system, chemotaxis family, response regulator Rcp1